MSSAQSFGLNAAQAPAGKRSRKRSGGQTGQSKSCLWINAEIISSSQAGSSVDELVHTISEHLHNMNLVNLTTAIHRLAKMVAHDAKGQARLRESPIFGKILIPIGRVLSSTHSKHIQPQSLCNILWSLASLRIVDTHVISLVCGHTLPNIFRFKPFELALLLWALAKLSTVESSSRFDTTQLKDIFDSASKYVVEHVRSIECRCLSMVVWAYATARQFDAQLFALVATQIANGPTPSCQEMANTIWAFGTQNITNLQLFKTLAQKGVENVVDFKAQEISNMLWGFASTGFFHEQFYQRAAAFAVSNLSNDLSTQHLANILWSFSRVRPNHHMTQRVVLSFLPICLKQIRNFKTQEVSSVALSVAKAFVGSDVPSSLPSVVLDFFQSISKSRYRLSEFSTHSLINMASALAMLQLFDNVQLGQLGREAFVRAPLMEASDLFRIFQVYLSAQVESADCAHIAGLLVSPLADRLKSLHPREMKALSYSCSDFLREANRQDLLDQCAQITESICVDPCMKSADASYACDASSGAETNEPEHSTSEYSDSVAEDAEYNTFGSDAKWNYNQQVHDAYVSNLLPAMNSDMNYFCIAMPDQQHFCGYGIDWAQQQHHQQPTWCNEGGSRNIPVQWPAIGQHSDAQNIGFASTSFCNESSNPVPPPSSLLWDVSNDLSSSSLSAGQDGRLAVVERASDEDRVSVSASLLAKTLISSLQNPSSDSGPVKLCVERSKQQQQQHEADDSTSTVVVKNTFIEYQLPNSNGISSVHFFSEQISRRNPKERALNSNSRLAELLVEDDSCDTDDGF